MNLFKHSSKSNFYHCNWMVFVSMITMISCKKFVAVPPPIDQLTTATVFSDSASALAAVNGLYRQTSGGGTLVNGQITLSAALSADELAVSSAFLLTEKEFFNNTIAEANEFNYTSWRTAYAHIYQVNLLIEKLKSSDVFGEVFKRKLMGEIKFVRALTYFYLVNLYGPLPLVTTSDYRVNSTMTRSGIDDVYDLIIQDLQESQTLLDIAYRGTGKVRPNKWAATALLARAHLYKKDWANAEKESLSVINSGMYSLPALDQVFLKDNPEAIMQFYPGVDAAVDTQEGYWFIPASRTTLPNYTIAPGLLNAFEQNDQRRRNWIDSSILNDNTIHYFPYKYKIRVETNNTDKQEYINVLRLGEQYLIHAEASAHLGQLMNARQDVDSIRKRAGLPLLSEINPTINQQNLLNLIDRERRIELFAEWGHRWFDLKRTGIAEQVLSPVKPQLKSTGLLFPIPQQDRLSNPFLTQNEGYN